MILRIIRSWVDALAAPFSGSRYKYRIVEEPPANLKPGTIYVIQDGNEPDSLVFDCPCGCGNRIELNLLLDCRPRWKFKVTEKRISISPSIWANRGCRSHFWIREGRVEWVGGSRR